MWLSFVIVTVVISHTVLAASGRTKDPVARIVRDLAANQQWREIVIVDCSRRGKVESFKKWREVIGSLTHLQLVSGDMDPIKALSTRVFNSALAVVVLPSCPPSSYFVKKACEYGLMNTYFSWWIIWNKTIQFNNSTVSLEVMLLKLKIKFNSYINVVAMQPPLDNIHHWRADIWDVYRLSDDTPIKWSLTSCWVERRRGSSFQTNRLSSQEEKIRRRSEQMESLTLRTGVIVGKDDFRYDCNTRQEENGSTELIGGFSAHLLSILMDVLQFKVDFIPSKTWGTKKNGESWSGVIGLIVSKRADLILCHPTVTADRRNAVAFLYPTLHSNRVLVYRPSGLPLTQDVFVLTFTRSLWFCLFLVLVLLVVSLRFSTRENAKIKESRAPWSWVEVTLWAISATCQQGCDKEPQGPSCRVVFMVGYIGAYLIFTAFAAGVTSILAVEGQGTHLELKSVARMHLGLAVYLDGLQETFFQESTDPIVSLLYRKEVIQDRNRACTMKELMSHLQDTNYVAMGSQLAVEQYMATQMSMKESCQLTVSQVPHTSHVKAFAVQKESPYKDVLNHWNGMRMFMMYWLEICCRLLRIQESGLLNAAKTRSLPARSECGSGPGYSSAGIGHVMSAVVILGSGVGLSLLVLLFELAWNQHKKQRMWENKSREDILLHLHHNHHKQHNQRNHKTIMINTKHGDL